MALTPAVVRYAATGLTTDPAGSDPAEEPPLREDLARGGGAPLPRAAAGGDPADARRARPADGGRRRGSPATLPLAEDVTVEADSGGHTDNRPLTALLPAILAPPRPRRRRARVPAGGPRRRRRRPRNALVGRGGLRARRRLRRHRLGEPGLRRERPPRERPGAARRGGDRRRDHGAGGRHVRAGRQGAGPAPRHDVRRPREEALRALPVLRRRSRASPPPSGRSSRRSSSGRRSPRRGSRRAPSGPRATRAR